MIEYFPEIIRPNKSIFSFTGVLLAIILSVGFHLLFLVFFIQNCPINLVEFWMFLVLDISLWILALIPLVSIARKDLVWFDPFSLLSLFFFCMVIAFFPAYILNPEIVKSFSAYGGRALQHCSESEFLFLVIQSELIFGIFWIIVMVNNRRQIIFTPFRFTKFEYRAAFWTFFICFIIGIIGFLNYWNLDLFLKAVTVDLGKPTSIVRCGESRYLILVYIATTSASLGIIGWFNLVKRPKFITNVLVLFVATIIAVTNMWNNSRMEFLLSFIVLFMVLGLFGFRFSKTMLFVAGVIGIVFLSFLTITRGNPYLANTPNEVISQILSGQAGQFYLKMIGSTVNVLLGTDRVSVLSMVLNYLRSGCSYLHGESLIAGPVNLIFDWIYRITGEVPFHAGILRMVSQVITFWRLNTQSSFGGVPPSIPGEFFMQWGMIPFLMLTYLFSKIFLGIRIMVATSRSIIARWTSYIVAITIAKLVGCEISPFFATFIYYILPIVIVYEFVVLIFKILPGSKVN